MNPTNPSSVDATPELLSMARRIVKAHYPEMPDDYSGRRVQIALAAIIETTEAAAKLAGWAHMVPPDGGSPTAEETQLAVSIASSLRAGDHLKVRP